MQIPRYRRYAAAARTSKTETENMDNSKKALKVLKVIGNVLIWIFVVFAVVITVLVFASQNDADGVPSLGGKSVINVLTNSMEPTINTGDIIIGQRLIGDEEKQGLKVDDVVTFKFQKEGRTEFNTHRIIEVRTDSTGAVSQYITKGDNKEANVANVTETVSYRDVVAVWTGTRFAKLGTFLNFLQTSTGFLVVIVIPLVLFFLYELFRFFMALRSVRKSGKKEITAADEEEIKRKAIEEYLRQQEAEKKAKEAEQQLSGAETAGSEAGAADCEAGVDGDAAGEAGDGAGGDAD